MERIRGQLGGMELARREPSELRRDLSGADPRRVEQRRAAHQRDGGRAGRDGGAAAGGLEAGVDHPIAATLRSSRIRSPQGAPPALPENDSGGA